MAAAAIRLGAVVALLLFGLFCLLRGFSALLAYGITEQIDAWVEKPGRYAYSQAESLNHLLEVAGRTDPWNPAIPYEMGRLSMWLAEHRHEARAERMQQAERHFLKAIQLAQMCGLCRLQLAYVYLVSGHAPARSVGLIADAVQLIGREWYAVEPLARLAVLTWGWADDDLRKELLVVFAFHLPHGREAFVPILDSGGLWGKLAEDVMAERERQGSQIRQAYGIGN